MPAIPKHKTATSEAAWDGPANEARLRSGEDEAYYHRAYAWQDPAGDPMTKAAYKFIHHEVSGSGDPGAANMSACSMDMGVLNGARGGSTIPREDRGGVHDHLAAHVRDGGREPPPLQGTSGKGGGGLFRLAGRVLNTPLAITREKLDEILAVIGPRVGLDVRLSPADFERAERRGIYSQTEDGIAVLDVQGVLVNRGFGMLDAQSMPLYSYEELRQLLAVAEANDAIRGIILRIESPGGEAAGLPDFASVIDRMARKKPIWTAVDDYAYSAAYWIASATNRIYVSATGGVGSVGVIAEHADWSKREEMEGVKVTTIFAGAKKNDFSPHAPLTSQAMDHLKREVEKHYEMFVGAVSRFRRMSKAAVRETEAGTYTGQDGIAAGLADRLGTFDMALSDMRAMLDRSQRDDLPAVITVPRPEYRGPATVQEFRQHAMQQLEASPGDEPVITGHIAVFGEWSRGLGPFIERIEPGAFLKSLGESDIHLYWNHDGSFVLGRNRSGTLALSEDESGLAFECHPPDTQLVRDLVIEPIRRRDVDQGSFAFLPVRQEWGRLDGELTRTLLEVKLFHVAIVPRGAYPQTDVGLRALDGGIDFLALAAIEAKCQYQIALSEVEREVLKQFLSAFHERAGDTTPGPAAHLVKPEGGPPLPRETHTDRLRLLKVLREYKPL